ncbi:MAG: ribosome biogenesis GTPase Der [Bdellovibrionales bacterium]|nr:ribosome biogenesis GTPase Der [Bdellovibrionales bacterium]
MKVLIMGRGNVGKSSLFNRLIKKKKSLVRDESGITRDLLKESAHWWGEDFEVIDSGGLLEDKKEELSLKVLEKIEEALKLADVVIVMVSAKDSLQAGDFEVIEKVRKSNKTFLVFVNKVDHPGHTEKLTAPFYELHPDFLSGSVENNYAVDEIVEWIIAQKKQFNFNIKKEKKNSVVNLFVIGRANSGKSLICNQILGSNRMIVSSQSGTTLDTVTDFFSYNKEDYSISDNPGSRRGHREEREKISFAKSRSNLDLADIVLLVLDVQLKPSRQESKLLQLCLEKQKPVLLVLNKTDLLQNFVEDKKKMREEIKKTFHFYPDLPYVFVSAKTAYHKKKLLEEIENLKEKINFKVSTSKLNTFFFKLIRKAPAPVYGTSDVKFYYVNQTNKIPPEFIAFTNYPQGVTSSYKRFIIKQIKKKWQLEGVPIAFHALKRR